MLLPYQTVRIPFPQKKAGFKDRWKRRLRIRGRDGTGLHLRGSQARTRRMRGELHEEAVLYRSGLRWFCVIGLWLALGAGAVFGQGADDPRLAVREALGLWYVGLFAGFVLSFFAAFSARFPVRMATSVLIATAGGLAAGYGFQPEASIAIALFGLGVVVLNGFRI